MEASCGDQGQAVEGVLIERLYPNSDTYMRVKTDSNGYYRIREQVNGLPQQMSLNAGKKGYQGLKEIAEEISIRLTYKQKEDEDIPDKIKFNKL